MIPHNVLLKTSILGCHFWGNEDAARQSLPPKESWLWNSCFNVTLFMFRNRHCIASVEPIEKQIFHRRHINAVYEPSFSLQSTVLDRQRWMIAQHSCQLYCVVAFQSLMIIGCMKRKFWQFWQLINSQSYCMFFKNCSVICQIYRTDSFFSTWKLIINLFYFALCNKYKISQCRTRERGG